MLAYITWEASPEIISIGPISLRWYGLMFALGFSFGFAMVRKMFLAEGAPEAWLDSLFLYLVLGTILGARLGHVLFYQPEYYLNHPLEILQIWRGGLASHGGVIGVVTALYLFSRNVSKKPFLWVADKVAGPIALVGAMIRFGNLMNSEIVGLPSDQPWAFHFVKAANYTLADVPRHPVQLYESISYFLIFLLLMFLYWKRDAWKKQGLLTGLWFALIFGARFVMEYFKSDQGGFDSLIGSSLSTGQLLSIPLVIIGIFLAYRATQKPAST
ncbi:MAG: prolipoprotein diacylglyceryl transferase [Bacteroidota bacterium]